MWRLLVCIVPFLPAGCGGDARVEISAGDALHAAAREMETTLQEYHREVARYDDSRETAAVAAFITRVRTDASDATAVDTHAAQFTSALEHIRTDRETEWVRRQTATDNVQVLKEVASGLQKLGIESLSLNDEVRRYLQTWMQARDKAVSAAKAAPAAQQ